MGKRECASLQAIKSMLELGVTDKVWDPEPMPLTQIDIKRDQHARTLGTCTFARAHRPMEMWSGPWLGQNVS